MTKPNTNNIKQKFPIPEYDPWTGERNPYFHSSEPIPSHKYKYSSFRLLMFVLATCIAGCNAVTSLTLQTYELAFAWSFGLFYSAICAIYELRFKRR